MCRLLILLSLFAAVATAQVAGNDVVEPVTRDQVEVELITEQFCWVFYDPATALPATLDPTSIWSNRARAITVKEFWCETDANTATVNVQRDDGTPANLLSSNIVCDTSPGQNSCADGDGPGGGNCAVDTIAAAEDNIAEDEEFDHVTVSLGTINRLSVCIKYTVD